jgi:hypothetical protein
MRVIVMLHSRFPLAHLPVRCDESMVDSPRQKAAHRREYAFAADTRPYVWDQGEQDLQRGGASMTNSMMVRVQGKAVDIMRIVSAETSLLMLF